MKYADREKYLRGSAARAFVSMAQKPGMISFAGGLPDPQSFPIDDFLKASRDVVLEDGRRALQYGPTEGFVPLREQIAARMKKMQVDAKAENIMVTCGSQQGLDFTAKLFLNPDDVVICESPTYLGALTAFNSYQPRYVEVETDDDGMNMEQLEIALQENPNAKFIYVIPDFQNPSGRTWAVERRRKLVELANKYDVVILEDCPYAELRFEGEMLPAVQHFDTEGRVIFLGTFSKTFSPGVRLGWICCSTEIESRFNLLKQGADLQSSTISQMELSHYMDIFDMEKHIDSVKDLYRHRRDLMLAAMEKEFPASVKYTRPHGGLFIWVMMPEHVDSADVSKKAIDANVTFIQGEAFYPNGGHNNCFRMNFSNMDDEHITEGVRRLGHVLHEFC